MKLDVIARAILNGEDEETVNELFQNLNAERTTRYAFCAGSLTIVILIVNGVSLTK